MSQLLWGYYPAWHTRPPEFGFLPSSARQLACPAPGLGRVAAAHNVRPRARQGAHPPVADRLGSPQIATFCRPARTQTEELVFATRPAVRFWQLEHGAGG
jgi:hypothetical protein